MYEHFITAGMIWFAGLWFATVVHEGQFLRAMAWPFDLLNYATSRYMTPAIWHTVTWPLVAVVVLRTFNIV